jgi:hypothetical protein
LNFANFSAEKMGENTMWCMCLRLILITFIEPCG